MKKKNIIKHALSYFFLTIGAIIMLFPFYWMVISSCKSELEYHASVPNWWPYDWSNIKNFAIVFEKVPYLTYFKNSIVVLICCVGISTFTTIVGAFAYSRLRFKARKFAFTMLTAFMMVPFEMIAITNYKTIVNLGLINSLTALWLPFTTSIFYTIVLKNFFDTIPDSLYHSAKIDGCSNWKFLWRVMVPVAKPSLFTIILLSSISTFNSFLWTQITVYKDQFRTVPLAIMMVASNEFSSDETLQMAVATLSILPTTVIFLLCRKYIVGGVARGGLKG